MSTGQEEDPGTPGYAYRQAATAYQHALETFGSMGSGAYWGEGDRWYALGVERQAAEAAGGEVPAESADEGQVRCIVAAEAWRRGDAATSPEIASAWRDASTLIEAADQAWKKANEATEKAQDAWNRAEAEAGEVPAVSYDAAAADATAAKPSGKPGSLSRNYTYSGFTLTPDGMRHQPCQELITDLYTALNIIEAVEYHQCSEEAAEDTKAQVTEQDA